VLDFEMTGLDPERDRVCEVAVVRGRLGAAERELHSLVRPGVPVTRAAKRVHGLTDAVLHRAPGFRRIASELAEVLTGAVVVCHNVPFDIGFLHREFEAVGQGFAPPLTLDTLTMSRRLFSLRSHDLASTCAALGVSASPSHRALDDARATFALLGEMTRRLDPDGALKVRDLIDLLDALAPNSPLRLQQKRTLRTAFRLKKTARIGYASARDLGMRPVSREIDIWDLPLPRVRAWCHLRMAERVFWLERIRTVEITEKDYVVPERTDVS
jgi:DNA polymerase III epsilon subunit family exonuclease